MRSLVFGAAVALLAQSGFGQSGGFEYAEWTNKKGQGFEAKLDHVQADKVILRAKVGGKRYPVKRSDLSDESKARLLKYMEDVKSEISTARTTKSSPSGYLILNPPTIYRAMALGMTKKLKDRRAVVHCHINRIRVTDRLTATIELEGEIFRQLQAERGTEFFVKNKTLNSRSSTKGIWTPYYYRYRGVDEGARVLVREGEQFRIYIAAETSLEWGKVGVTEGPVIR